MTLLSLVLLPILLCDYPQIARTVQDSRGIEPQPKIQFGFHSMYNLMKLNLVEARPWESAARFSNLLILKNTKKATSALSSANIAFFNTSLFY